MILNNKIVIGKKTINNQSDYSIALKVFNTDFKENTTLSDFVKRVGGINAVKDNVVLMIEALEIAKNDSLKDLFTQLLDYKAHLKSKHVETNEVNKNPAINKEETSSLTIVDNEKTKITTLDTKEIKEENFAPLSKETSDLFSEKALEGAKKSELIHSDDLTLHEEFKSAESALGTFNEEEKISSFYDDDMPLNEMFNMKARFPRLKNSTKKLSEQAQSELNEKQALNEMRDELENGVKEQEYSQFDLLLDETLNEIERNENLDLKTKLPLEAQDNMIIEAMLVYEKLDKEEYPELYKVDKTSMIFEIEGRLSSMRGHNRMNRFDDYERNRDRDRDLDQHRMLREKMEREREGEYRKRKEQQRIAKLEENNRHEKEETKAIEQKEEVTTEPTAFAVVGDHDDPLNSALPNENENVVEEQNDSSISNGKIEETSSNEVQNQTQSDEKTEELTTSENGDEKHETETTEQQEIENEEPQEEVDPIVSALNDTLPSENEENVVNSEEDQNTENSDLSNDENQDKSASTQVNEELAPSIQEKLNQEQSSEIDTPTSTDQNEKVEIETTKAKEPSNLNLFGGNVKLDQVASQTENSNNANEENDEDDIVTIEVPKEFLLKFEKLSSVMGKRFLVDVTQDVITKYQNGDAVDLAQAVVKARNEEW